MDGQTFLSGQNMFRQKTGIPVPVPEKLNSGPEITPKCMNKCQTNSQTAELSYLSAFVESWKEVDCLLKQFNDA
jgi:hypothetical protein